MHDPVTHIAAPAVRLSWPGEFRATVMLALPLIATQLAQTAIMTTDVLMMGWLGPEALAAGALGFNLYIIFWVSAMGIVIATAPMMAQAIGRKLHVVRDVRRSVRQGFWVSTMIGAVSMLCLWHTEAILLLLGQEPQNAAAAQDYNRALLWGFIPALWFLCLRQFVAAFQRPRAALLIQIVTFLFNAALAYVLMFGKFGAPAMGVVGAGIASALANGISFALILGFVFLDRDFRRFQLLGRFWRSDWRRFREMFRLGSPIAATMLFEVAAFGGAVYIMGLISTDALAAHQIAMQCAIVTFMVPLGIGQAATVRVGLFAGAGDREGIRRAGWSAIVLGVGFMAVMAATMLLSRHGLVGLFLEETRPENFRTAEIAASLIVVAALFQMYDGAQAIGMGVLRGLKDTRVPMMFAGFGYWILGLPVGAVLAWPFGLGALGVWIGLALGLLVVSVLVVTRFARRDRLGLGVAR